MEDALEKLILGPKRDLVLNEDRRRLTAYHEAGHALVWCLFVLLNGGYGTALSCGRQSSVWEMVDCRIDFPKQAIVVYCYN